MKSFRTIITEAPKPKTRVLLFGRMNPITRGHEENVMGAHAIAQRHGGELHVVASHSHDPKKNPLSPEQKMTHMKRAFGHLPNTHLGTSSAESPSILHQATAAHRAGVKHFVIAGGGDRAEGYRKLLNDYNGVEGKKHGYYKFDKISVENTGERREGVSGTDMRKHAASGNFEKFRAGLPSRIAKNEKHSQEMYHHVRSGMGVHEETREPYVAGQVLLLGEDVVDSFTGLSGKIVYRGPTYVTVQIDETTSFKRWIDDIDVEQRADALQGFRGFATEASIVEQESDEELTEKDIKAIEDSIDGMSDAELERLVSESTDLGEDELDEELTAADRMKKKLNFLKSKSKREVAATISRHRSATQGRLKSRSISAARRMIMKRLLAKRKKSQLSAAEKTRIETILSKSKNAVVRISNRLMPKLRQLELKRMRGRVHEANQATDLDYDAEKHAVDTVAAHDTDVANNERLASIKKKLQGQPADAENQSGEVKNLEPGTSNIDPGQTIHRLKHFRKMEV